jgi:hypothetical protein
LASWSRWRRWPSRSELCEQAGYQAAPVTPVAPGPRAAVERPGRLASGRPTPIRSQPDGAYDFVGIVMAKSAEGDAAGGGAEGDAAARLLAERDEVEVIEQPSFLGHPRP